jgi:hypothetical protein
MNATAPEVQHLLVAVRRRLRLGWVLATTYWAAPAVAALALALVVIGRFRPWAWPERAALGVAAAAVLAVVVAALVQRISLRRAALAADRGLNTRDAFSTVLETDIAAEPFGPRIAARAGELARVHRGREAVALRRPGRRLALALAIGGGAIGLALVTNPQDRIRSDQAAERKAVAALADQLAAEKAKLAALAKTDAERAALDELNAAIAELRTTDTLAKAEDILRQTAADLSSKVPNDLLTAKAAAKGLTRNLESRPLAAGATTADQLTNAAAGLENATPEERKQLAERLAALAESQRVGDPTTAKQLAAAASALQAGDVGTAATSLQGAAASATAAQNRVAAGEASKAASATAASTAAKAAAQRAANAAGKANGNKPGSGKGSGSGKGQGSGSGSGSGKGQGTGQGSGQGQGQGQGGGGGNPSGVVGGQGAGGGTQGGKGGAGRPGGKLETGPNNDETPKLGDITLPPTGADGETINAGGAPTGEPGEVIGKGDGATQAGSVSVPVANVLPKYRDQALDALDRSAVPPADRKLVTDYFDRLAGNTNTTTNTTDSTNSNTNNKDGSTP